jgi:glycosyltransferase involved in cell wall biosynthesis
MKISVFVPTYRRPNDLTRCLEALIAQTRPADEILVTARTDDAQSWIVIDAYRSRLPNLKSIEVMKPGLDQAQNAALAAVTGDVLACTDDDGAPHPNWLSLIEEGFARDPHIGGIGGRDLVIGLETAALQDNVGIVQWFGRVVGNHHIGSGIARPVHVLKGVNCAYRVAPLKKIGFELGLRGPGAQIHSELVLGLKFIQSGWTLIYDPGILVDHYPAARHDIDQRNSFVPGALSNEVHNETLAVLRYFSPVRRLIYLAWFVLCGTRSYPGILCGILIALRGERTAFKRMTATLNGRFSALRSWRIETSRKTIRQQQTA